MRKTIPTGPRRATAAGLTIPFIKLLVLARVIGNLAFLTYLLPFKLSNEAVEKPDTQPLVLQFLAPAINGPMIPISLLGESFRSANVAKHRLHY